MLKSISAKLLFRMVLVTIIGLVIGLSLILKFSSDLKNSTAENLTTEKREQALMLIQSKIETALSIAQSAVSANPNLGKFFLNGDDNSLYKIANNISDDFKRTTHYHGLSFVAFDQENRIFMRSFAKQPDPAKGKKAPRDFSAILSGKVPHSAEIDLSGVGLFITASVPVHATDVNSPIVGVLDIRSGLGSIARKMQKEQAYFIAVLNDKALERWKKGQNNPKLGSYYLAHNDWFKDSVKWFRQLDMDHLIQKKFTLKDNKAITVSPLKNSDGDVIGYYLVGIDMDHPDMVNAMDGVNQTILLMLVLIVVLMGILMLFLWHASHKIVTQPIQSILSAIRQVEKTGKIDIELNSHAQDEVGDMTRAFGSLLNQINQALKEANQTVKAIADGDFSRSMQGQYQGDLATLKEGVNASAKSVEFMMNELSKVMQALENGQFDVRMDSNVAEGFRQLVEGALQSIDQVIREINVTLSAMQKGQFDHRVEIEAKGELQWLKTHVNESLSSLNSAINEINTVMSAQASGDLTQTINGDYQGQLDTLKQSINRSSEQLNQIVTDAMEISVEVNNAANEVSRGALDLSDRVQQQAASLEETSATMDEMTSSVQNTTGHSKKAAQVALDVQQKAHQGNTVMHETIDAMNAIQDSSHKINEIVTLIDGIAFQTNLLALNAAVEAARAGDHGRGFAVVAGEVRNLAQKSAEAAKNITGLIQENVTRIDKGTQLATESGEVLNQIMESVEQVSIMIEQIAQASSEQAEGIGQVNKAIAQIDSGTQQNAALVEQTSAAAESLNEQANILRDDMDRFKTQKSAPLKLPKKS